MKKAFAILTVSVFALCASHGVSIQLVGPASFKMDAITQSQSFHEISSKTNSSATATNVTSVFKSAIAVDTFANSNLLALLANSFNTNFPAGSQIGIEGAFIVVVDQTGTNVIFNPSAVVTTSFDDSFVSDIETEITTENQQGLSFSGNNNETITESVTFTYDDTAQTTGDGTHTKFQLKGLLVEKQSEDLNQS